jgi:hypothetical protein
MIVLVGLVILIAAVVVGVAGVLANGGGHPLTDQFAVFGYHVTGSTGALFLYGIVVGAVGVFGLGLLLADARRTARRGRTARRELKQSRRETATATQNHHDVAPGRQRETRGTDATASTDAGMAPDGTEDVDRSGRGHGRLRGAFGRGRTESQPGGPSHSGLVQ